MAFVGEEDNRHPPALITRSRFVVLTCSFAAVFLQKTYNEARAGQPPQRKKGTFVKCLQWRVLCIYKVLLLLLAGKTWKPSVVFDVCPADGGMSKDNTPFGSFCADWVGDMSLVMCRFEWCLCPEEFG
jgi:hypothetical protein